MNSFEELLKGGINRPLVKSSKPLPSNPTLTVAPKVKAKIENLLSMLVLLPEVKHKQPFEISRSLEVGIERLKGMEKNAVLPKADLQLCPYSLAEKLAQQYSFAARYNNVFVYDKQLGYYKLLKYGIGRGSFDMLVRKTVSKEEACRINTNFIKEIRPWLLSSDNTVQLPDFNEENFVAFQNGTFDLMDWKLKPHSEAYRLTAGLNCRYIDYCEEEIYDTKFWGYVNRLADYQEDVVEAIRFMLGLALSNIRKLKMAFFLYGPSNNGKSVFGKLLLDLIGSENVTTIGVSRIGERFMTAELFEKLALISFDENTGYWSENNAEIFKKAVSCDPMIGEYKGEKPFDFRPYCLFICMGNDIPKYTADIDKGDAISERIFAIPTGPSIPKKEQNRYLLEQLLREKDLIASWAIEGLQNFLIHDKIPQKLVEMTSTVDELDPISIFEKWVSARVELSPDCVTKSCEFYQDYAEYFQTVNQCKGKALVERAFYMQFAKKYGTFKQKVGTLNCYKGIKIKEE